MRGLGIFTTFGTTGGDGNLASGTTYVNVLPIGDPADPAAKSPEQYVDIVNSLSNTSKANPDSGIDVCLANDSNDRHVILKLAGKGRKFGTETTFLEGACP